MTTPVEEELDAHQATVEAQVGFTPGPWQGFTRTGYVYGPDCIVAVVGGFLTDKDLIPTSGGMWAANTQLIAMAPTLLEERNRLREALEKAEATLARVDGYRPGMQIVLIGDINAIKEARSIAREALGAKQP